MRHPKLIYDDFSFKPNLDLKKLKIELNFKVKYFSLINYLEISLVRMHEHIDQSFIFYLKPKIVFKNECICRTALYIRNVTSQRGKLRYHNLLSQ